MENYDDIKYEMYLDGAWVDVATDVVQKISTKGVQGILGSAPLDRVAETGTLTFSLRNDAGCSGAVANYYTPGHANCRAGFGTRILVRLYVTVDGEDYPVFYGKIPDDGIDIKTNIVTGYVGITVYDWMNEAAEHEMYLPTLTTNKRMDEAMPLIVANMDNPPLNTDYNAGTSTFATLFDILTPKTRAMSEFQKLCNSELGFVYERTLKNDEEILVCEGRGTRGTITTLAKVYTFVETNLLAENGNEILQENGDNILLDKWSGGNAEFDNSMKDILTTHGKYYANTIKGICYPRFTDAAATTTLFTLQKSFQITIGDTKYITGHYRDPTSGKPCSGTEMVTPPTTPAHYKFTANEDGSGADLSANLTVTPDYGANAVEYKLEAVATGWVYKLIAVGKGIYTYDPVIKTSEDAALVLADGEKRLDVDMKYQTNPNDTEALIDYLLSRFKVKTTFAEKITFIANRSAFLMRAFCQLTIGDLIHPKNTRAGVDATYFIQGREFEIRPGGIIEYSYYIRSASLDTGSYWKLGISTLEETTVLGI